MNERRPDLAAGLRSGGAYGLGLVLGVALGMLLLNLATLDLITQILNAPRFISGLILAFLIMGLSGGVGGFAGGYTLKMVNRERGRSGYAWRSAVSFAIPFSLLIFLAIVAISLLTFYNVENIPASLYVVIFLVVGLLFGVLFGIIFGLLSVRRQGFWRTLLVSLVSFALGGAVLGIFLWNAVFSFRAGEDFLVEAIFIFLGLIFFGGIGGLGLGWLFSRMSREEAKEPKPLTPLRIAVRVIAVAAVLVILIGACRPLREQLRNFLTPQTPFLTSQFDSNTIGTDWRGITALAGPFTGGALESGLSASGNDLALSWSQPAAGGGSDVFFQPGAWDEGAMQSSWSAPINVSNSPEVDSGGGEVVLAPDGVAHLVWSEGGSAILYSQCDSSGCLDPVALSSGATLTCETGEARNPAITLNRDGILLAAWETGGMDIPYVTWPAGETPPSAPDACILEGDETTSVIVEPRLGATADGTFWAVAGSGQQDGEINAARLIEGNWETDIITFGRGRWPELYIDPNGDAHVVYCDSGNKVQYINATERSGGAVGDATCAGRPVAGMDSDSNMNVVWYSEAVVTVAAVETPAQVLYESHQMDTGWSPPAIVGQTGTVSQPVMATAGDSSLHLAWNAGAGRGEEVRYASFVPYACDPNELEGITETIYNIARQEKYRAPDNPVPFCQNLFVDLVHTPNPDPAFSDQPQTENGAFDVMSDLAESAQYEVLFTTMWYEPDEFNNDGNPGSVFARSVKKLYDQLKADPGKYPRGLTVRILLGNPPELSTLTIANQLWYALEDLRDAGVPEMVNEEIGWKLEVANYRGAWPHSHTKGLIVDGARMIGAGFNYQYAHYPEGHPSGKSSGRWDLGMAVSGPVVQDAVRVFDDMWNGATLRHCSNLHPVIDAAWQATCRDDIAVATHVPEVSKYYLPGGNAHAFSMFRSFKRDESDQEIIAALGSAQESLEIIQVNFAMDLLCNLNYLYDVCNYDQASQWAEAIVQAAENGAKVRIMLKLAPGEGIENSVTIDILTRELEKRGLSDRLEVRTFATPAVHYKAVMVDDKFILVGSQNFHYSAFGEGQGLTEYSLGTDDPRAVEGFKKLFEFHWEQATPVDL